MNKQLFQVGTYMNQAGLCPMISPLDIIPTTDQRAQLTYLHKLLTDLEDSFSPCGHDKLFINKPRALGVLAQLLYAVLATSHQLGQPYLLPVAHHILHDSFMTSFWTAEEVDNLKHDQYTIEQIVTTVTPGQRAFRVTDYRGKLVKSPSFIPPNFTDLFTDLSGQQLFDFEHAQRILYPESFSEDFAPAVSTMPEDDADQEIDWSLPGDPEDES